MAEGWTRALKGDVFEVFSAGLETHGLNPDAVRVMAEAGVDISGHKSQLLDDFLDDTFDYVVTVCDHAHETCPLFPGGATVIHHRFEDPPRLAQSVAEAGGSEEAQQDCYRRVCEEIRHFVETLPEGLNKINPSSVRRPL